MASTSGLIALLALCIAYVAAADIDCSQPPKNVDPKTCCTVPSLIDAELMGSCFKNKDNKTSAECFSTCISKKLNLLKNGAFDSDAFKAYISKQAATDAVWSPIVNEALKNCTVIANNMPTGDSKCDRSIESNIGCLHFAMLKNCPTTKKSTSAECVAFDQYLQTCPMIPKHHGGKGQKPKGNGPPSKSG